MKNITFSVKDEVIDELRRAAARKNTTVNELFRAWADAFAAQEKQAERTKRLGALQHSFEKVSFISDRKYTRAEMNER